MPVTAIVTCFVLPAFSAEVGPGVACGRSSAVPVGVFSTVLDGQDEQPLARPMTPTTPITKNRWNTRVLLSI
jgi:hypothetical protein